MYVDVLVGLQWGDEGKGKIVDYLAGNYDIIARFQGGPNAGHTLKLNEETFVLHTIPSGIFHEHVVNIIGNGVVIDPVTFRKEAERIAGKGIDIKKRLILSDRAHLILPTHKILDAASETRKGETKIGSTLRGIGPTYMDKTGRNGLRVGDIRHADFMNRYQFLKEKHLEILRQYQYEAETTSAEKEWIESIDWLRQFSILSTEYYLNDQLARGKKILAEGAQGSLLDIDFGTYPFVTSSNTISAGACIGLGIAPSKIREIWGISKAYCTRVGGGPFPTELTDDTGNTIREIGHEYGATTGRPRRCGWLDLPALKYAVMLNGTSRLIITKLDVFNTFENIYVCTDYYLDGQLSRHLPANMHQVSISPAYRQFKGWLHNLHGIRHFNELPSQVIDYIHFIESYLNIPVVILSTGPKRDELILKQPTSVSSAI